MKRQSNPAATAAATLTISVSVKPNARDSSLQEQADGSWCARVRSPPVDGRANRELIDLVARHFGCAKSAVSIRSGSGARRKLLRIEAQRSAR